MSVSTIDIIMSRIKSASKASPIAVFKLDEKGKSKGKLNAVFGATVKTQELIKNNDNLLVGVYDNTMDESAIRAELIKSA